MRQLFFILIFLVFAEQLMLAQKLPVTFTVTFIQPYCGGARPSPEMEERAQTPQPYSNKTIVLRNGKGKCLRVKTDSNGVVVTRLKAGEYKVLEVWRAGKKSPDGQSKQRYDSDCLKQEWNKELAVLTVILGSVNYQVTNGIILPCDWNTPCLLEKFRSHPPE